MSEPTTEAGRRLLDDYPARYGGALYTDPVSRRLTIEAIAAIEAEARAAERERIAKAVERLIEPVRSETVEGFWNSAIGMALAIIREQGE